VQSKISPVMRKAAEVDIRPLAESDLPALLAAFGRADAHYFRRRLPLQKAGLGLILVAFRKRRPVGAVLTLWAEPAQERKLRLRLPGVPLLYHIHVVPVLRCRGIGTQLLAAVHDELRVRGHERLTLGVDTHNKDARRLYERLGYEMLDKDSWGKGKSQYEAMVLDLRSGDRTEFLGSATSPYEPEPPTMTKQDLDVVINELLGETSLTPPEANKPESAKPQPVKPLIIEHPVVVEDEPLRTVMHHRRPKPRDVFMAKAAVLLLLIALLHGS
jgi:GNAT superfamily N-acetyltransferase